ncbi:MAG: LPD7 domain-containing protein [Polyangiaceae bacterium]
MVKAGPVEVIDADGNSQGTFGSDGKPVAPSVKFEKPAASKAKDKDKAKDDQAETGVRLESLGKGVSVADVDEKTNQVVIRRSGRVIERFADDQAVAAFAEKKKLSDVDRETLTKLAEVRNADRETRDQAKASLGPDARATAEMVNVLSAEAERGRVRAEVERNDAEVHAWVEKQRKLRQQREEPIETEAIRAAAAASAAKPADKGSEAVEREATFAAPSERKTAVPSEVESQYLRVGEKYYHSNNTKAVAFVDRGDKLETPSSAPKMAEALVKIAEARGWDEMRVKGTEGFRREVWLEASVRGIHVDGYKPSELDKAELERRNTFMRDQNSVEVRSEAFQKLNPEEGVRKDPTLASAYATEAAAKRFAEKMPPENRAAFVQSVREAVTHKLEQGEPVGIKLKVPEGKLVEHGEAKYNFDKDEKPSYYVKVAEANGRERTYWGVGLQKAMIDAQAQPGDTIQLRVTESKGVVVEGNVRDADGKVVGRQTVDSHRNEWQATVTARAKGKAQERQPEEERQR